MYEFGFIGLGNMASALIKGFLSSEQLQLSQNDIIGFDISESAVEARRSDIVIAKSNEDVIAQSRIIFVAVKPQVVESVLAPYIDQLKNKVVVSIVLGYDYERYNGFLDASTRHLTIMPNLAVAVKQGMCLLEAKHNLSDEEFNKVNETLMAVGETVVLPSHLMSVGGALSGCGPAYVYMVIEALADGAVANGLPRKEAYILASQTVAGAASLQLATGEHPGVLKDQVTSPAGSTIKGVMTLENGAMRSLFINAITNSMKKS